jgi:hypothetical protein
MNPGHTPEDRSARTANARRAMLDKFELEVDPDGKLTPAERGKRAEHARKAHFKRLALKSARVRRSRGLDREATVQARMAELDGGGDHAA